MTDVLYLAWRYLAYHRFKTALLIGTVTVIVYLPIGLDVIVDRGARDLTSRADSTPLLVGQKGSPLELVLNSLYFESGMPPPVRFAEVTRIAESGLARAIPIYARFRAGPDRVVGTTLEYFKFRGLEIAQGRPMAMLGECVLGSAAADRAGVGTGGYVTSSPEGVFDLAGVYPLRMKVVGVLRAAGTADDRAVFVDVKTAWVIEGLAHGHQDLSRAEAGPAVLRTEGDTIIANASVVEYNEITADNVSSFHFHGDPAGFPVTAVIVLPHDQKSRALLEGRYLGAHEQAQVVQPSAVMDDLLGTVFTVRGYAMMALAIVAAATLVTMTLVFVLSIQLRRRELETMSRIGGTIARIRAIVAVEILGVLGVGVLLAAVASLLTGWFAMTIVHALLRLW